MRPKQSDLGGGSEIETDFYFSPLSFSSLSLPCSLYLSSPLAQFHSISLTSTLRLHSSDSCEFKKSFGGEENRTHLGTKTSYCRFLFWIWIFQTMSSFVRFCFCFSFKLTRFRNIELEICDNFVFWFINMGIRVNSRSCIGILQIR